MRDILKQDTTINTDDVTKQGGASIAKTDPFEKYSKEYDNWFIRNKDIYQAELKAINSLIPINKEGIEIGVGSGRFALPLGIKIGVEPSKKMAEISRKRGIQVYQAVAEKLPFIDKQFDFILMISTICFLDDLIKSFKESYRVLKNDGLIIVGFVDKESILGTHYQLKRKKSKFYKDATFYSGKEVLVLLRKTDFKNIVMRQTVFSSNTRRINLVKDGYGEGIFVIIIAIKQT